MAKQTINIGTSPNKGDGDPLRVAMGKINDNFDELYAGNFADPQGLTTNLIPDIDARYDLGSAGNAWADLHIADYVYLNGARIEVDSQGNLLVNGAQPYVTDITGSIFADDSTILVDAVNGIIPSVEALKADIKSAAAASVNFADFQARIAAL